MILFQTLKTANPLAAAPFLRQLFVLLSIHCIN